MPDLWFVTASAGKFREAAALLPGLKQLPADLPEIQEFDAKEIIRAKLEAARHLAEGAFIVEDTSLFLDALGGLPGPLIKWFMQRLGARGLHDVAARLGDTRCTARTWVGYMDREVRFFEGAVSGSLVAPRGEGGFGWDPIFQPEGADRTFGQMEPAEKQAWSMRRKALEAFRQYYEGPTTSKMS